MANVVGSPEENRITARPGSSSRPRGLPPASADPDRTPAAWRSDLCRESQGGWEKAEAALAKNGHAAYMCVCATCIV